MSSSKTERLVNLTMALLASRRFMTKSEIFRRVAGYSGSQETKERMFERDKDDLRNMGIEIEVGGHDPLFDDEPGYRILPERYQLPAGGFTSEELGIIATALHLWRGSPAENETEAIARRFQSLGIESRTPENFHAINSKVYESGLLQITESLARRKAIRFVYAKLSDTQSEIREIHPLGISAWQGSWYVIGEDLGKNEIRAFKLSRIVSQIETFGKEDAYEIPEDFDVREYLIMFKHSDVTAAIAVRKEQAFSLRNKADSVSSQGEEWDLLSIAIDDIDSLAREILWLGDCVMVQGPAELRKNVLGALVRIGEIYG